MAIAKVCDRADPSSRLGVFRNRLRAALEIEHMAIFFRANAYFQIKSNEDMTKPDSPEFQELEKLEIDGYEQAKKLRQEILQEVSGERIVSYGGEFATLNYCQLRFFKRRTSL